VPEYIRTLDSTALGLHGLLRGNFTLYFNRALQYHTTVNRKICYSLQVHEPTKITALKMIDYVNLNDGPSVSFINMLDVAH
jgi:hypothetical protein